MKKIQNLQDRTTVTVDLFEDNSHNCIVVKKTKGGSYEVAHEAEMLARVGSHKNIVTPLRMSAGEIILPWYAGGDLFNYILANGSLPEALAKPVTYAMLEALCHLHKKSIVHRDIKLENILITEQVFSGNNVILIDFGHAVSLREPNLLIQPVSLVYTAPEVFEGSLCFASDIWSLGVTLATALLGSFTFDPMDEQKAEDEIRKGLPSVWNALATSDLSSEVVSLLRLMLAMDPSSRITPEDALNHMWFHCGYSFCH